MPKPWEATPDQARAEAETLERRREHADREDAPPRSDQARDEARALQEELQEADRQDAAAVEEQLVDAEADYAFCAAELRAMEAEEVCYAQLRRWWSALPRWKRVLVRLRILQPPSQNQASNP